MEKKTTQRIIGIIVAVALVIILLPLLLGKRDPILQTISVNEPPFPEQQIKPTREVEANPKSKSLAQNKLPDVASPIMASPIAETSKSEPIKEAKTEELTPVENQPAAKTITPNPNPGQVVATTEPESEPVKVEASSELPTPSVSHDPEMASNSPASSPQPKEVTEEVQIPQNNYSVISDTDTPKVDEKLDATKSLKPEEVSTPKSKEKQPKISSKIASDKKLNERLMKEIAWAVQLGSFKDKNNAKNLADKLRAAGYKAFTREVKSQKGTQTRVYIGPESQQASAAKLSTQLEQEMKLHGFVVMYKPLEL